MRLTDLSIKALKPPEKGETIYPDDALAGFGVRVSQGGTKSFVLTHGKLRKRETVGRVGIISLSDAVPPISLSREYCSHGSTARNSVISTASSSQIFSLPNIKATWSFRISAFTPPPTTCLLSGRSASPRA
jgi:hypothetical protein